MTSVQILSLLHFLALFLMTAGLGAVMVPVWRGWGDDDLDRRPVDRFIVFAAEFVKRCRDTTFPDALLFRQPSDKAVIAKTLHRKLYR